MNEIYEFDGKENEHSCQHERVTPHKCPYRWELHDDETLCSCCEECEDNCRDDI